MQSMDSRSQRLLQLKSLSLQMMKEFDLSDAWTEVMKGYSIIEKVGEGSYGQVFKA